MKIRIRGFTILEFLIAMVILYLTVSGIYYLYEVMSVYVKGGTALLSVNASGRNSVERMIRFIRQANMISIQDSGNRIEVRYDENNPPTKSTLDDTNIAFYYNNGDGKDSTLGDNRIYFDPDNAQNTANTILVSNVRKIGANSIFSLSDNYTVNINYKIEDPYSPDGYQAQDISIKVTRRN